MENEGVTFQTEAEDQSAEQEAPAAPEQPEAIGDVLKGITQQLADMKKENADLRAQIAEGNAPAVLQGYHDADEVMTNREILHSVKLDEMGEPYVHADPREQGYDPIAFDDDAKMEALYNTSCTIHITADPEGREPDVIGGHNGRRFRLQRGKNLEVPFYIPMQLATCWGFNFTDREPDLNHRFFGPTKINLNEYHGHKTLRFPVSLVGATKIQKMFFDDAVNRYPSHVVEHVSSEA